MRHLVVALPIAAVLLLPHPAFAQAKPIDVYVSAVDAKGDAVQNLTAADFRVTEDGNTREVLKAGPATEPLTIALLVDDSQAASRNVMMIREGVQKFIDGFAGKAEIALITYGERPTVVVDYTTDQKKLDAAAGAIFPRTGSGGYLLDAITEVTKGLQKRHAARPVIAVLMLEDDPEFSTRSYSQVISGLNAVGATLDVVAIGTPRQGNSEELRNRNVVVAQGTEESGGRRDQLLAITATPAKMAQLADELLHQYVVTYARPDRLIQPQKREVTVARPGVTVRARTKVETGAGK